MDYFRGLPRIAAGEFREPVPSGGDFRELSFYAQASHLSHFCSANDVQFSRISKHLPQRTLRRPKGSQSEPEWAKKDSVNIRF